MENSKTIGADPERRVSSRDRALQLREAIETLPSEVQETFADLVEQARGREALIKRLVAENQQLKATIKELRAGGAAAPQQAAEGLLEESAQPVEAATYNAPSDFPYPLRDAITVFTISFPFSKLTNRQRNFIITSLRSGQGDEESVNEVFSSQTMLDRTVILTALQTLAEQNETPIADIINFLETK